MENFQKSGMSSKEKQKDPQGEGEGEDASDKVKVSILLFELLDEIIQEVGEKNVVQVITYDASNFVLARKMLESKYKTIFWTPCAVHCIDLMLEDIGKVEWVKSIVENAK